MTEKLQMKIGLAIILSVAIIAGYYGCGGGSSSNDSGSSAVLYSTGVLDTTFGGDGVVTTTIGSGTDFAAAIAMQADGKIVAAGSAYNGANYDFALARYNVNGSLDTTFDTDGLVTTTIGSSSDFATAIAIQADGKMVVAGYASTGGNYDFALARYTITGTLDTAFDTDGVVTTTIVSSGDYAYALAIQTDGKIVIAGSAYNGVNDDFTLARYNVNGSLDTTFDTDGLVTTTIGSGNAEVSAIVIQPDGKMVVAGYASTGGNYDFALARYNVNGSLDTTFDTDGLVTTTIGSSSDFATAIAIQADGKMVVAGYASAGVNNDFALARYNLNGSLDTTFDTDGIITTTIVSGDDLVSAIVIQPDGKIVAAGYAYNGANNDFALARYNVNGSLDTTFDTDGLVTTTIGSNFEAYAIVIQPDGKIVVAGYASGDFALARYWR